MSALRERIIIISPTVSHIISSQVFKNVGRYVFSCILDITVVPVSLL